jgi:hypothetical protein
MCRAAELIRDVLMYSKDTEPTDARQNLTPPPRVLESVCAIRSWGSGLMPGLIAIQVAGHHPFSPYRGAERASATWLIAYIVLIYAFKRTTKEPSVGCVSVRRKELPDDGHSYRAEDLHRPPCWRRRLRLVTSPTASTTCFTERKTLRIENPTRHPARLLIRDPVVSHTIPTRNVPHYGA